MNHDMAAVENNLPPTPWDLPRAIREQLRASSKTLLGNRDRLEVAVAIAFSPDGIVNAADLSEQLQMANNRVRANLLAFAEAGLLEALPRAAGSGRRWFTRTSSPFWVMCMDLYNDWIQDFRLARDLAPRRG
jgi:hypothetical protein